MVRVFLVSLGMILGTSIGLCDDLPVLLEADFADGSLEAWKMSDPKAWRIADIESGKAINLFQQSKYAPKVRSPVNYALWDLADVTDFQLDLKAKSTTRDYGHRDLCLFFGYQDPEHFYYVHLAKAADPHAHSVFLVNGAPRVSIADERTPGVDWGSDWHQIRLVRNSETGEIAVFFDDMATPIITAKDKAFSWGKVGVGSFDDTGMFTDIVLRGKRKE
jgi:hypothetical protein